MNKVPQNDIPYDVYENLREIQEYNRKPLINNGNNIIVQNPYETSKITRDQHENLKALIQHKALRDLRNTTWWGRILNRFIK